MPTHTPVDGLFSIDEVGVPGKERVPDTISQTVFDEVDTVGR